jgi:nitrogen fixation NifU-like protein
MENNFDLYTKNVMKYFTNPKNIGVISDADAVSTVGNPKCGDVMKVYIKVALRPKISNTQFPISKKSKNLKQEEYIKDIKVQTLGCGAAIATSSIATEMVKGKSLEQALKITNKEVADKLGGLPKVKYHCSMLAEDGIKSAILKYKKNKKV